MYLTNTPRVDVVATSPDGRRTINIQVKTKRTRSRQWHWDNEKAKAELQASETDYMILVDLYPEHPEYYIHRLSDVAEQSLAWHDVWLKERGGKRPRNERSTYMSILMETVASGRGAWDVLGVLPQ